MVFVIVARPVMCAIVTQADETLYTSAIVRMMYESTTSLFANANGLYFMFQLLELENVSAETADRVVDALGAVNMARVIDVDHKNYWHCVRVVKRVQGLTLGAAIVFENRTGTVIQYDSIVREMLEQGTTKHEQVNVYYKADVSTLDENCRYLWPECTRMWEQVKQLLDTQELLLEPVPFDCEEI